MAEWDGGYSLYILTASRYRRGGVSRVEYIKIGHAKNVKNRFKALNFSNPMRLKIYATVSSPNKKDLLDIENELKTIFSPERVKGEWFFVHDTKMLKEYYQLRICEILNKKGLRLFLWE